MQGIWGEIERRDPNPMKCAVDIATATYLINRLPTNILKLKTPLQTLSEFTKLPPALTLQPRIFGCSVFVHIPKMNRTKLDPCAEKCVFVGYGVNQKGYRCYNPKTRHMFTTMNCDFLETEYYYNSQHNGQEEKECLDTLCWLKYFSSSEEISHSTKGESLNTPTQSVEPIVSATENALPNLMPEVSNTYSSGNRFIVSDHGEKTIEQVEPVREEMVELCEPPQEETPERYVLPPRANRGIPPKRYSPERETRGSKYPVTNIAKGNLSEEARAFVSSLYSEETPATSRNLVRTPTRRRPIFGALVPRAGNLEDLSLPFSPLLCPSGDDDKLASSAAPSLDLAVARP
nr:putative ribonuclease H-like domain-containing protein [Ipomoea trifida]